MCIAIYKPEKVVIKEETLNLCWVHNSDGAGFAYVRDGSVIVEKGFMGLKDFKEAYFTAFKSNKKSPFLIHFRIRTDGDRDAANTHPFELGNGGVMIHNGCLSGSASKYGEGPSDTNYFVQKFGQVLTFANISKHKKELEAAVGYNKLAFLFPDGNAAILNESSGVWSEGSWYSNHTFKPRPAHSPSHGYIYDED